jgi:4-hydroxy-tetrahydrodipicolinate synthase
MVNRYKHKGNAMFKGSIVALITPFVNDHIDEQAFVKLLNWQVQEGTDAIVVCGSTGESMTMTGDEQARLIELAVATVNKRVPVIAGTAAIDTAQTIRLTQQADRLGADGILIVTPPYIKPSQEALYQHYKAIAASTTLPIILYNNPSRAAVEIELATVERLAQIKNIVGLKDATPGIDRTTHLRRSLGKEFLLFSGEDATAAGYLAHGGDGCISVTANVAPRLCAELQKAWRERDLDAFATIRDMLHPLNKSLFIETNPCPVKYAVSLLGFCEPELRAPLLTVNENSKSHLKETMKQLGLVA